MKKAITIIILLMITMNYGLIAQRVHTPFQRKINNTSYKTSGGSHLPDSIYHYEYYRNSFTGWWEANDATITTYNTDGTIISEIHKYMDLNTRKLSDWVKSVYTYDSNYNVINFLNYEWDNVNKIWHIKPRSLTLFTYDSNNNLTSQYSQNWDSVNNTWITAVYDDKYSYTYDTNNNMTCLLIQIWDGNTWINDTRELYTYDLIENSVVEEYEFWHQNNTWSQGNPLKYVKIYDIEKNLVNAIYYDWDTSFKSWTPSTTEVYTYDANKNLIVFIEQDRSGYYVRRINYTYDVYNNKISESTHSLPNGGSWYSIDSTHYYYKSPVGINNINSVIQNLTIYPKPATNIINIQCNSPKKQELIIYNILGEIVYKDKLLPNQTQKAIDLANLSKGIYIIRVGDITQKIVIE